MVSEVTDRPVPTYSSRERVLRFRPSDKMNVPLLVSPGSSEKASCACSEHMTRKVNVGCLVTIHKVLKSVE